LISLALFSTDVGYKVRYQTNRHVAVRRRLIQHCYCFFGVRKELVNSMGMCKNQEFFMRDIKFFEVNYGMSVEAFTTKEEAVEAAKKYKFPVIRTILNSNVVGQERVGW